MRYCYFTGGNDPFARLKRALKHRGGGLGPLYRTESRPFARPATGKWVKVINDYGDEVINVFPVGPILDKSRTFLIYRYTPWVDYLHPIEALIPGARGQVLAALTRNTSSRTIRQLSVDAGISWSRTSEVIEDLADLGIVERRRTPGGILVQLVEHNVAAKAIDQLTELRSVAIRDMRHAAEAIQPAPASLTLFGSFARGTAGRDSDVDVVAVFAEAAGLDLETWQDSLSRWAGAAAAITGSPVNLIVIGLAELMPSSGRKPAWINEASEHGIVLAGKPLQELMTSRRSRRRRA